MSTEKVNLVSWASTFLKLKEPESPDSKIGPWGLGGTHLPTTGHTYSPPTGEVTTRVSLKVSPI